MDLQHTPNKVAIQKRDLFSPSLDSFKVDGINLSAYFNTHGYNYSMPYTAKLSLRTQIEGKSITIESATISGKTSKFEYLIQQHVALDNLRHFYVNEDVSIPVFDKDIILFDDIPAYKLDKLAEDNGGFLTLNIDYISNDKKNTMTFKIDRVTGTYDPFKW